MTLFATALLGLFASASAGTPSDLIGVWRGLPIQHKYNTEREQPIPLVEWEMNFAEGTVDITNQHGTSTFKVSSSETGQLTMTGDATLNCAYSLGGDQVEVTELSVGCGTPSFTPDAGKPEQCMPGGKSGAVVNLWKCIDGKHCKFSAAGSINTNIWTQGEFDTTDGSANGITGTWRGTQISDNYASGEWDFTFFSNGTLAYVNQVSGAVDYGSWEDRGTLHGMCLKGSAQKQNYWSIINNQIVELLCFFSFKAINKHLINYLQLCVFLSTSL